MSVCIVMMSAYYIVYSGMNGIIPIEYYYNLCIVM